MSLFLNDRSCRTQLPTRELLSVLARNLTDSLITEISCTSYEREGERQYVDHLLGSMLEVVGEDSF